MKKITVIILTKNEEKNISEAVNSAHAIADRITVVDSGSEDGTIELAQQAGADVYTHQWQGHARQFNWALDNVCVDTEWVFRLDADERISAELAGEINQIMGDGVEDGIDGFEVRWRLYFMGRYLKHGGCHDTYFVRLFRYGKGRIEDVRMDEHTVVDGEVRRLRGDLIHHDYKGLDAWVQKHLVYSNSEIEMYLTQIRGVNEGTSQLKKRLLYYRLPPFIRARLYYWYRYYIQLGFLDGREGQVFLYLQSYWYRYLVDAKLYELEKNEREHEKASADSNGKVPARPQGRGAAQDAC